VFHTFRPNDIPNKDVIQAWDVSMKRDGTWPPLNPAKEHLTRKSVNDSLTAQQALQRTSTIEIKTLKDSHHSHNVNYQ
jgi:hypothetical protein